jgi:hypothetical protein
MRLVSAALGFSLLGGGLAGQEPPAAGGRTLPEAVYESEETFLPRQFRAYSLGMALDALKDALAADDLFLFQGDRDVQFIPIREETLVESQGRSFVTRAFFQLREGAVFSMTFSLNAGRIDHYSVYTALVKKYGEPEVFEPRQAIWEDETTRVSLERPLTVKYLDKAVFQTLQDESQVKAAREILLREEFLNDF